MNIFYILLVLFVAKSCAETYAPDTHLSCKNDRIIFYVHDKYNFTNIYWDKPLIDLAEKNGLGHWDNQLIALAEKNELGYWDKQLIDLAEENGQTYYQFSYNTNLTKKANEIFVTNFPPEFSFEGVFRNKKDNDYNLFEIFNKEHEYKVHIKTDSFNTTIEVTVPRHNAEPSKVVFNYLANTKKSWYTMKLIVTHTKLILWIDCFLIKEYIHDNSGSNVVLDSTDSTFIIGREENNNQTSHVEIQYMIFRCYHSRLEDSGCDKNTLGPFGQKCVHGEKAEKKSPLNSWRSWSAWRLLSAWR